MLETKDLVWIGEGSNKDIIPEAGGQARSINNMAERYSLEVCQKDKEFYIFENYTHPVALIVRSESKKEWVAFPNENQMLTMKHISLIHRILDAIDSLERHGIGIYFREEL